MNLFSSKLLIVFVLNIIRTLFAYPTIQPLIFGGKKATENQFPFLVSLRVLKNGTYKHDCGASIISDKFLVTAAHCYKPKITLNDYRISIGALSQEEQGNLYKIEKFIVHPEFNAVKMANDIALIRMEEAIHLTENVTTIGMSREFIDEKISAIIAGWGKSEDGYTGLEYAEVTTMSNKECRKISLPRTPIIDFMTLCAFSGKKNIGICLGDSGGPLINNNKLIGISSWGIACAKGFPDGFSRISTFAPWINNTLKISFDLEFKKTNKNPNTVLILI